MTRLVVLGSMAALFSACVTDIPVTAPGTYIIALFDPSTNVVPTPTILVFDPAARLLKVPLLPGASPAQADFVAFLNSLDGYPEDTPGKVSFSLPPGVNLDPATVTANTVLIFDGTTGARIAGASAVLSSSTQLSIVPPATGWPIGRLIAVALIGGDNGVKGTGGTRVIGSAAWGLVRSSSPLVTGCADLFLPDGTTPNPACVPTVTVIPSNEVDPAARLVDQRNSAVQLERLRLIYAPLLDGLQGRGIAREDVPIAWTFPVTSRPQVTFDPARNIIPFPNDVLRTTVLTDGGRRVSLPIPDAGTLPDGGVPDIVALYTGLNTLDGFSTTSPIVSVFNADAVGALNQGKIDAGSLVLGAGWGFSRLTGSPAHTPTDGGMTACLDCASSLFDDGGTPDHPQRLQFVPNVPLDEKTTYGVYLTTNVTDTQGRRVIPSSAFALLRSANPLYDGTHTTVDLITDDQALSLEQLRMALSPFITNVANAIGGRSNLALAWAFTTQTEVTALAQLNGVPAQLTMDFPQLFPDKPIYVIERPPPGSHIFLGEIVTPEILSGQGGTLDPLTPKAKRVPLVAFLPSSSTGCPTAPYAVTIFGHGLTRSRADAIALANTLTASPYCQAIIATDVIWHGHRSFCAGSLPYLKTVFPSATSDNDACVVPGGGTGLCDTDRRSPTYGRCIALTPLGRAACASDLDCLNLGQGLCLSDNHCEGGDFRRASDTTPLISGWNIVSLTNFFATRDNFRQQVVDLAQLTSVIRVMGPGSLSALLTAAGGAALDGDRISYVGQSLGGILGTLYTSVAQDVHHVVLNVPGADPTNILLTSPSFASQRAALFNTLTAQGITQGSIAFDTFIGIARWIIDAADPQNMAFSAVHTAMPLDRKVLVQYITEDQVIPNGTTVELLAAGDRSGASFDLCLYHPSDTDLPPASRHGFLLNFVHAPTTLAAQIQAATYVSSDTLTPCP